MCGCLMARVCLQHQARIIKTEEELMYGSKPTTPSVKRRFLTPSSTLCKTPTKIRRVSDRVIVVSAGSPLVVLHSVYICHFCVEIILPIL